MEFYTVRKRSLAFELSPETRSYRGQLKVELALRMADAPQGTSVSLLTKEFQNSEAPKGTDGKTISGQKRVQLEASILAKQVKVIKVFVLARDAETGEFKKDKELKFSDGRLAEPSEQAMI